MPLTSLREMCCGDTWGGVSLPATLLTLKQDVGAIYPEMQVLQGGLRVVRLQALPLGLELELNLKLELVLC